MPFSTKNKTAFITMTVVLITVAVGYNFIYKANLDKTEKLRNVFQDNERASALLREIEGLRAETGVYLKKSSASADVNQFLSNIADTAASCGIKIDTIVPGTSTTEGDFIFLACRVNFTCPYRKLRLFMTRLEGDKRFIKIENITAKPVRVVKNSARQTEDDFPERPSESTVNQMLKRNKADGIWLNADMEIKGFYFDASAING